MAKDNVDDLYSIAQAARLLSTEDRKIVPRSLHRAVTENNIPTVPIGNIKAITLANAKIAAKLVRDKPGNPGNDRPRTVKRNPRGMYE